jgi:chorismate lyase/3-hydroxybenzoate synthase
MSVAPSMHASAARLSAEYVDGGVDDLDALLRGDDVLAIFGFGPDAPPHDDPRYLRIGLAPYGPAPFEVWRGAAPVTHGRAGIVAWSDDGLLQFGAIELDETALTGLRPGDTDIEGAAAQAYRALMRFTRQQGYPHLLRSWNYFADITAGEGDDERYRRFCVGRAHGIGMVEPGTLPAATAIGRTDGVRRLQVYWLAAREPGVPLENPRQVSAYRYPRQYGPQPPSFARAMMPPPGSAMPLLLSGTAAVVGHETRHVESVTDQVAETFANFDSLLGAAHALRPSLPLRFDASSRLKVYVRDHDELPVVQRLLDEHLGPHVPRIMLHAAICRRDLRMEIDGMHDA